MIGENGGLVLPDTPPGIPFLAESLPSSPMVDTRTDLCGVELATPIVLAAGTCGYVDEMADALDLGRIGAVTTKSITLEPRPGHDPNRILDAKAGMINAIGLANVGLDRFLREKAPLAATVPTRVIGSVAGGSVEEYVTIASSFDALDDIPIIEMNVSCPNTHDGRQACDSPQHLESVVAEVRAAVSRSRLLVKLPPKTDGIVALAEAAVAGGADGLTMTNTLEVMSIDVTTRRSRLSRPRMGYSGTAIHPLVVRLVHDVHVGFARAAGVPIIGLGGVGDWEDAAELILAGATAVGMGTALYADPRSPNRVLAGLERWARSQGCASISELVGAYKES